ncbi:NAD(P)-binding protein [Thozetella sp. PMI_491]|nr:NAD(P)-binding protein [Thozetella sp. PMI_491]
MSAPLVPRSLEGKLAIVTGASRGIGAAIATNLASKGANIVINFTSPSSEAIAAELGSKLEKEHSVRTKLARVDLGSPEGAAALVDAARQLHADLGSTQPFQIDILINNAGVAMNNSLPDITLHQFHETYRVNVLGPLLLVQAAASFLPTDRSGRIISVSSVSSTCGFVGQSVYGGSKAAIEAMTRTWARELSERATVNCINPGPVEGPMYASNSTEFLEGIQGWIKHTPLMRPREDRDPPEVVAEARKEINGNGRPAYTHEVAGVVGMLCTADSSWVTGQVVSTNGGMLMLH